MTEEELLQDIPSSPQPCDDEDDHEEVEEVEGKLFTQQALLDRRC